MADQNENVQVVDQDTKPEKKRKKTPIIWGAVAVVIIAAGIGFFVWHQQPTFCNAICHSPMDQYVATYVDGTHDAYGNEISTPTEQLAMMATMHGKVNAADCLACHEPSLGQQISEGMHWVTGGYEILGTNPLGTVTMEDRTTGQLVEGAGMGDKNGDGNVNGDDFCLRSGCHVAADGSELLTRDQLIEATADLSATRNPHLSQHGDIACSDCHKAHSQSVNYCSQCHNDAPVPDGWLTAEERAQKTQLA